MNSLRNEATIPHAERKIARPSIIAVVLALGLATFVARWALRCDYLLQWDTLQSAAAISYYDVSLQTPHPPGAPVYALLLRLTRLAVGDPHYAVLLVASVMDGVAVVLLFCAASVAISVRAAFLAALIYLFSPLACHSATVGLTFGLDASFSAAVGLFAVRLRKDPSRAKAILLGLLVGLAQGARYKANWASAALVPLSVYGLWRSQRTHVLVYVSAFALAPKQAYDDGHFS